MQETWVWFLGWKDPLEKGKTTCSSILAWTLYTWGHKESDRTERLSLQKQMAFLICQTKGVGVGSYPQNHVLWPGAGGEESDRNGSKRVWSAHRHSSESSFSIINLLVPTDLGSTCLWAVNSQLLPPGGVSVSAKWLKDIVIYISLGEARTLSQGGTTVCLDYSSLVSSSLLFPTSKYLNLPFGTQVKSWRLNEVSFL